MSQSLNIICQVERLGPKYDTGWTHFSLNVSAAFAEVPAKDIVEKYLKMWEWMWKKLRLRGISKTNNTSIFIGDADDSGSASASAMQMVNWGIDDTAAYLPFLKQRFLAYLENGGAFNGEIFSLATKAGGDLDFSEEEVDGDTDSKLPPMKWHSIISQEWNRPQPIPINLKLCVFFRIKDILLDELRAKGVDAIAAAPVFEDALFKNAAPISVPEDKPLTDVERLSKENLADGVEHFVWKYAAEAAGDPLPFSIAARLNNCSILDEHLTVVNSIIDLRTRFVKSTELEENWMPRLTEIITDAFDLPLLLLNVLRTTDLPATSPERKQLVKAFISSLHDRVHQGVLAASNNQSLSDYVAWKFYSGTDLKQFSEKFRKALAGIKLSYATWVTLLTKNGIIENITDLENATADALDVLYSRISDTVTTATLVLQQWDPVLSTNSDTKEFWKDNKEKITEDFAVIDLRRMLSAAIAGIPWKNIPRLGDAVNHDSIDEPAEIAAFVATELKKHVQARFETPSPIPVYDLLLPKEGAISSGLQALINYKAIAENTVNKYISVVDKSKSNNEISSFGLTPETLNFKIDRVQQDAATTDADQSDLIRNISGSVVVLRKKGGTWRCLNYVGIKDIAVPFVAPLPYGYTNELRQSSIEYNNQPLVSEFAKTHNGTFEPTADSRNSTLNETDEPRYLNPYMGTTGNPHAKLVPLQYGQEYEALICAPSTASALPKEMVAFETPNTNAIPWKFTPAIGLADQFIHTKTFRRRVKVGSLSFKQADSELKKLVQPQNVTPLAKALIPATGDISKQGVEAEPLILLPGLKNPNSWTEEFKQRTNYRFRIFPPNTNDKIWERWTAGDQARWPKDLRKKVLAAWNKIHDTDPEATTQATLTPKEIKHTIDDPAASHLRLEFAQLWPKPAVAKAPVQIRFTAPDATLGGLAAVQSAGIEIIIETKDIAQINTIADEAKGTITVQVPEGQIWRLSFFPIVDNKTDRDRFAAGILNDDGKPLASITETGEKIFDKGYNILVEVASPFPAGKDFAARLNNALRLGTGDVIQKTGNDIKVSLSPDTDKAWPWIHRVETLVQRWRWNGRPLAKSKGEDIETGFPFNELKGSNADIDRFLKDYEGILFSTREPDDHLVAGASATLISPDGQITGTEIYKHSFGSYMGAMYFRFGVKAYSRYEGVMVNNFSVDSRADMVDGAVALGAWKRIMVLCRYNGEVPAPIVRFAIPLTNAIGTKKPMPGVLIVMDEPGYSDYKYGFAEMIEADIEQATTPEAGNGILEMGPDPILRNVINNTEKDPILFKPGNDTITKLAGPIGYTFDTNTDAPAFTRSSYIWSLPDKFLTEKFNENDAQRDYSFYFIKARFRRKIDVHGHALGSERKYLEDSFASAWTEARWLRILPPSNVIKIKSGAGVVWENVEHFSLTQQTGTGKIKFAVTKDEKVNLYNSTDLLPTVADGSSRLKFVFYLLLTKVIPDALGKQNSEAFLKFIPVSAIESNVLDVKNASLARLVEVAYDHKTKFKGGEVFDPVKAKDNDIFDALVPVSNKEGMPGGGSENKVPVAMITRVSPAFKVELG
jgi:hypothetical protein